MLTYKAMYKFVEGGVHAEVLDFPGVITSGRDLEEARRMLRSALVDMADTNLQNGESLPQPDPKSTDPEADLEEPIHLLLTAASRVAVAPDDSAAQRNSPVHGNENLQATWNSTSLLKEKERPPASSRVGASAPEP